MAQKRNRFLPKPITKPTTLYDFCRRLIEVMEEEPARVDQGDWMRTGEYAVCEIPIGKYNPNAWTQKTREVRPACNTVGCTAGWASVLLGHESFPTATDIAADLGLDIVDPEVSNELFEASGYNCHVSAPAGTAKHMQQVVRGIREFMVEYKGTLKRILVYPKGKVGG